MNHLINRRMSVTHCIERGEIEDKHHGMVWYDIGNGDQKPSRQLESRANSCISKKENRWFILNQERNNPKPSREQADRQVGSNNLTHSHTICNKTAHSHTRNKSSSTTATTTKKKTKIKIKVILSHTPSLSPPPQISQPNLIRLIIYPSPFPSLQICHFLKDKTPSAIVAHQTDQPHRNQPTCTVPCNNKMIQTRQTRKRNNK